MAKGDILIAEDDAVLRNLYLKKFAVAGYTIRAVENGEEALKALQERAPDIAILDIHMPKVDGFQVLEQFPRERRTFPVIMLTNFADEKSKERGKELGVLLGGAVVVHGLPEAKRLVEQGPVVDGLVNTSSELRNKCRRPILMGDH